MITPLAYDASGLRTTKTATWEALDKVIAARAAPDHLPLPEWANEMDEINVERERKGLPPAIGRRFKQVLPANYNDVRW